MYEYCMYMVYVEKLRSFFMRDDNKQCMFSMTYNIIYIKACHKYVSSMLYHHAKMLSLCYSFFNIINNIFFI